MLDLKQIEKYYPENLRPFKRNILREYLQYKILEVVFNSRFADKVSFLGGTALRIIYDNSRFSEDLDFDNLGLDIEDFSRLVEEVKVGLEREGQHPETRNVFKGAYRCYLKLPGILFDSGLSGLEDEKITIQMDAAGHDFAYQPENKILNKFDVFTQVKVTPPDILLAQKIYAALNRKRAKGRDFFDIIFLLGKTKPNYDYLRLKVGIGDGAELKRKLEERVRSLDMDEVVRDVEPFLFQPSDGRKIKLFGDYIRQADL